MPTPVWKRSETWGLGIALATLILVFLFGYLDWNAFEAARLQVDHTHDTLNLLSEIFSESKDLETGQRGFVLVGKLPYLAPYEAAKATIQAKMTELDEMTAADTAQHVRAQRIAALLQEKTTELQKSVDARQNLGFDEALAIVETGRGKVLMDRIRAEVAEFQLKGHERLKVLEREEDRYRLRAASIGGGGSALLFVLLVIAAVLVRARSDARERALSFAESSRHEVEQVRDLLQTTLRSIGDAVITTDANGRVTFLNSVGQNLTGWGDDSSGRPLNDVFRIVNEHTRETVESPVDKVRRTGMVAGLANHTLLLTRDGREIPIDDSGAPIRDRHGATVGFVLVFRDISERKAAENALRESEDRFRTMANAAPVLLWVTGPDGNVNFLNRQWEEFTGRGVGGDLHTGWTQEMHPDDRARIREVRRAALEHSVACSFDCRLRHRAGEYRSVMCTETPRFTVDGGLAGYVGACFDVTELKQAQRSLEISEERFRTLVAGTTSMVWQTDAQGAGDTPLPEWEEFTGQTFEQYRGFGGTAAMHPDDRDSVSRAWKEAVDAGQSFMVEFRLWHQHSKQFRHVVSRGVPLMTPAGELLQWIGTITDVTEQRALEEKLRQAAKLESLGVLAGGIAHDFNNLLVGILGNASLLQSMVNGPEQQEIAGQIMAAGERAGVLTNQMLAYSGRGRFVVAPTDLSMETEQIVPLVRSSFPKHVELILTLEKALPAVEVDRAQFQQLVMNLLINAAEAIDGSSGKVTVATYAHMLSPTEIDRDFAGETIQPGPYAVLEVRDDGHGMDPETQAKIFDPFFTTKFTGRGLGLAAVIGIARGHKGAIRVTSAPGSGSTFRLFLPATGAPLQVPSQRQTPAQERGKATVLVVDDEEIVRKVAKNALTMRGYRVLLATNGREALEMFAANLDVVTAIVLDLTMPVMSGEDALPRLRALRPDVRILASSGYSQSEAVRRFGDAIDGFIQKPYSVQSLLAALQETLQPAVG